MRPARLLSGPTQRAPHYAPASPRRRHSHSCETKSNGLVVFEDSGLNQGRPQCERNQVDGMLSPMRRQPPREDQTADELEQLRVEQRRRLVAWTQIGPTQKPVDAEEPGAPRASNRPTG
jgi:hypothetical protein